MNWSIFQTLSLSLSLGKNYSRLSLDLDLYQGVVEIWKISVLLRIFVFVRNTFKAEGRQKIDKKGQKWAIFKGKVQFSASIHDLNTWSRGNFDIFPWIRVVSVSTLFWSQNFEQSQSLMYQKKIGSLFSVSTLMGKNCWVLCQSHMDQKNLGGPNISLNL